MTSATVISLAVAPIGLAHVVKTDSDVAATYHLEPNHNPKAGEKSTVWFALTKAGGQQISLSECDCQLTVQQADQVVKTIAMRAINAEQYQGIPGGDVTFPKVGIYQLVFSGKAKDDESFQPFELKYDVTVQPGQAVAQPEPSTAKPQQLEMSDEDEDMPTNWLLPGLLGAGATIALAIVFWLRRDR